MLNFTQNASRRLEEIGQDTTFAGKSLLLSVMRGPAGRRDIVRFVELNSVSPDAIKLETPFPTHIEKSSEGDLKNATLDYQVNGKTRRFLIETAGVADQDETYTALKTTIESKINPQVRPFGGFISLLEIKDETAFIHYGASCPGCSPNVPATVKRKFARQIESAVPVISRVLDSSESAGGANPYFRA